MGASKKPTHRAEAELREFGLSLPETIEEFPWDHRALKVARKVFVFMGTDLDKDSPRGTFSLSCKLPESGSMALMLPGVTPTGYGLGKSGWVSAKYPTGKVPVAMLKEWLRESYCAVAPKKLAALVSGATSAKTAPKKAAKKKVAPKKGAKKKTAKR